MAFFRKHSSTIIKVVLVISLLVFAFIFRFKENYFLEYLSYGAVVLMAIFPVIDKIKNWISAKSSEKEPRTDWLHQKDYDFFIGRKFYIQELLEFIEAKQENVYAFLLYSAGGIGKTALTRHVVGILKQREVYNDESIIWLKNRNSRYDPSIDEFELLPPVYPTYESLIIDVARILNVEGGSISDVSRCEAGIRIVFERKKLLLVLDGIEDSKESNEIVTRFLKLFSDESKTKLLITSRQNINLVFGKSLRLKPFTSKETEMFIKEFIQQQDAIRRNLLAQGTNVVDEIHKVTKGNPLTLKVFLSHLIFSSYQDLMQRVKDQNFEGLNQYLYSAAWNRLRSQNPLTLDILFLLAERRNRRGMPAKLIGVALNQDMNDIVKSLKQLLEVSMIEIEQDGLNQVIKLHSNIRSFVLSKMEQNDKT